MKTGFYGIIIIFFFLKGLSCYRQTGPAFIQEPPSSVHFLNEVGLELNCSASGMPRPVIQWKCGSSPCSTISGLRLIHDTLTFLPFLAEAFRPDVHDMTYRCAATNSFGTVVKDVAVKAFVRESIEPRVVSVKALRDYPILLRCEFPSDVGLVRAWIRDDVFTLSPNESSNKYLILPDGHLLIWQVSSQDFYSKFQCRVSGRLRTEEHLSSDGRILLQNTEDLNRPIIQHMSDSVIVEENSLAVLPCITLGNPKPLIQWYKKISGGPVVPISSSFDDLRFDAGNKITIRQGILMIPNAKRLHSATYICNASNSYGSEQREIKLIVHTPLRLSLAPLILTVDMGKAAEFSCSSNDELDEIEWLKDGVPLRPGSLSGRLRFLRDHKIQINRVVKEDQGIYQCLGKNLEETQQKAAQLWLGDSKPMLLYTFIDQTVVPGTVISVRCKGTGWPLPQVNWYLDGFILPQSERFAVGQLIVDDDVVTSYVNITSVSTSDSGEYTCTFRNKAGEMSHSNRINVYGDLLIRPMNDVVGVFGKTLKVKCPVGGYPIDSVTWSKGGLKLPKSVHQKTTADGILTLENVMKSDAGTYQCTALRQTQVVHGVVEVNVVVPPSITPFTFGNPVSGNRVTVLCSLTTDLRNISIQWYRDNFPIDTNTTTTTHTKKLTITRIDDFTSSLTISSLTPEFNGNYTCKISSVHSHISASWTSTLSVNVPPRITKFNFEDSIVEGMKVQALCFSQGSFCFYSLHNPWELKVEMRRYVLWDSLGDLPLKFRWFRDEAAGGTSLISQTGFDIASFGENSEILTIGNVTVDMSGVISCEVSNRGGKATHSANLVIKVPPKFIVEPSDVSASLGSSLKLRCEADGRPEPKVKWLQEIRSGHTDYRDVENTPGIRNLNGTLLFTQLMKEHDGLFFLCQASNDVGPPISKRIQVTLTAPPRIRTSQGKEIVEIGQTAILRCLVDGDHPIRLFWKFNGQDLPPRPIVKKNESGSELTIDKVRLVDRGEYTCVASNPYGHDFVVISLLVQEQPKSPVNLRSLQHTSRSVTLAWSIVAYVDVYVIDFILRYRQRKFENWTTEFVPGDQSTVTMSNLLPFTTYDFTISARNQVGTSQPSDILTIVTGQEPPSPVRHVTVEEIQGLNELRVSWVKPEYPNGLITHYNVFYHKSSDGFGTTKYRNVPGSRSSVNLRGVESFMQYSFVIRGVNGGGFGQNSTLIQMQTREGKPKYSPQDVQCQSLSSKSLQISWKPPRPPHNGLIIGFRVNVDLIDDAEKSVKNSELESEVTGTSTVIQGLREFCKYNIQVAGFTSEGTGPPSRPLFCETKESFPNEPTELKVVEHAGYVILAWFYAEKQNETLRKYHIYVRTRAEGQIMKKSVPATTMRYELRHLGYEQIYEACVTAENAKGEGKPSRSVTFKVPRQDSNLNFPPTILSFGQRINTPWKSDVVLECHYAALSKATVIWKRENVILPQRNDTLTLKSVNFQESGNYTCIVSEAMRIDQITHVLNVQIPPAPPILETRRSSGNGSTILTWRVGRSDCCRILGFSLNYRQLGGEWEEEIGFEKKRNSYEFLERECFSKTYEMFLISFNKIGTSLPSDTIEVEIEGFFSLPTYAATVSYNASTITLNFTTWNIFDCENGLLIAEYKAVDENYWILASMSNLSEVIYLRNLRAEKDYHVRIRVQSMDAEISKEFTIPFSQVSLLSENLSGIYRDVTVILPMGFALVLISSAVGGTLVFLWRRRKEMKNTATASPRKASFNSYAMQEKGERDYTIIREKQLRETDHIPESADDIHPYATFDMTHQPMRSCQNLRVEEPFYGHGNQMIIPEENDYGYRHRRSRSRSGNSRCREADSFNYESPNSSSVFFGDEATTMIVTDKRKSLPRTRQTTLRYGPDSSSIVAHCYLEHSCQVDEVDSNPSSISQLSGANLVTRKVKRRKTDPDPYTCPHDYMFINV